MNPRRPIQLGVAVPTSTAPQTAVEIAAIAEELGYDLLLLTDDSSSPAERAQLDSWTLLSWIAARTERLTLAAVEDESSRLPAVRARASASFDLLAGGRAALAMTGRAPELTESIGLTRRIWSGANRPIHHAGHYRLGGIEPGPLPAHELPIWAAGDDPDTLKVAGTVADGWLTWLNESDPDDEATRARLDQLDAALTGAGRDLQELRRIVVAQHPTQPTHVTRLADLITGHGITTVVLDLAQSDRTHPDRTHPDLDTSSARGLLERFVTDVDPTLQDAGRAALHAGKIPKHPLRRTDTRQQRRGGIDYDGLPEPLAAHAVEPGDLAHGALRSTYLRGGDPGLILRPRNVADVQHAIAFARRHTHLPLGLRSGGHGFSGRSTNDGGLVIDLAALGSIEVLHEHERLVRIGPAARWRDVATALQPHGWALSSGDFGGVGVGGLATAGGIGFLGREHGLTIDHLRGVEMVLADGSVVRADEHHNTELFWAVRGAGANFGIVTAFDFVVDDVPDVGWAQLAFQFADAADFLVEFGRIADAAPRQTTPFLVMTGLNSARILAMVASDDPDVIIEQLQPFARIPRLVGQQVVIAPYAAVMNMFPETPHQGQGEPVSRSGLAREITPQLAEAGIRLLSSGAAHWFQLRTMGGAIADVPADATAFAHRDARFQITAMGAHPDRVDQYWNQLRPHLNGTYLSFETDTSPQRLTEAYPPRTLERLRRLKADLDPNNLFRDNFSITAEPASTPEPTTTGSAS